MLTERPDWDPVVTLASLLGVWRGGGTVSFPSVGPGSYDEEMRFTFRSADSVDYWQQAAAGDGSMLHSETGIWRMTPTGSLEISVALPGAAEVSEGIVDGQAFVATSKAIGRAATGIRLRETSRRYEIRGDTMRYQIWIATEDFPLTGHLRGELHREVDAG